jgi:antitoxin ParD1/3/4
VERAPPFPLIFGGARSTRPTLLRKLIGPGKPLAILAKLRHRWYTSFGGIEARTTLNISLPEPMRDYVDQQVAQGSYSTASEYIRQLVREDQKRAAKERLETLMEGIESGPSVEITDQYWAEKKAKLLKIVEEQQN